MCWVNWHVKWGRMWTGHPWLSQKHRGGFPSAEVVRNSSADGILVLAISHLYLNTGIFATSQMQCLPEEPQVGKKLNAFPTQGKDVCKMLWGSPWAGNFFITGMWFFRECVRTQVFPPLFPCLHICIARIYLSLESLFWFSEWSCTWTYMCEPRWWNSFWILSWVRMLQTFKSKHFLLFFSLHLGIPSPFSHVSSLLLFPWTCGVFVKVFPPWPI